MPKGKKVSTFIVYILICTQVYFQKQDSDSEFDKHSTQFCDVLCKIDDTMNQIESINLSSLPVPVKRKAVLDEPAIPLCADDDHDYRLEIASIDLLSCDAPGLQFDCT